MGAYTNIPSNTVTFQEIRDIIDRNYNYQESIESTTMDIIAVYLRGQKVLYTEAKVYCEQHLYALMLPAIFITALCSVLSVVLRESSFGGILVSGLTATNSFILSLVTYLKLDGKAEAHKIAAYSFETLQSLCEFSSGKVLLSSQIAYAAKQSPTMGLIQDIGEKVKEIKEKNQFILPEYIRYNYPRLCSTNVFAEVKRIQNQEIFLINKLKTIINERLKIEDQLNNAKDDVEKSDAERLLSRKKELENETFTEILLYKNKYIEIDTDFKNEINENIAAAKNRRFRCCNVWLKT